jgi:hypothetical protein
LAGQCACTTFPFVDLGKFHAKVVGREACTIREPSRIIPRSTATRVIEWKSYRGERLGGDIAGIKSR